MAGLFLVAILNFLGVANLRLVQEMVEAMAGGAQHLPIGNCVIRSVVISMVDLENADLDAPAASLTFANLPTVFTTYLRRTCSRSRVTPRRGCCRHRAGFTAKTALPLPACGAILKRGSAPLARPRLARLLQWAGLRSTFSRYTSARAVAHRATLIRDDERFATSGTDLSSRRLVALTHPRATHGAMTLASIRREGLAANHAQPVRLHGKRV